MTLNILFSFPLNIVSQSGFLFSQKHLYSLNPKVTPRRSAVVQNPPKRKGFTSMGIIFPFSSGLLHEPGNFLNVTLYQFYLKNIQDQFYTFE